jgi:hypothetical protein
VRSDKHILTLSANLNHLRRMDGLEVERILSGGQHGLTPPSFKGKGEFALDRRLRAGQAREPAESAAPESAAALTNVQLPFVFITVSSPFPVLPNVRPFRAASPFGWLHPNPRQKPYTIDGGTVLP